MLQEMAAFVVDWVKNSVPGGIIEGDPRTGKTKMRRGLAQVLKQQFVGILVFPMIAREYIYPSERTFFGDLLKAVGHKMHLDGTAAQRRDRLTESIIRMVRRSGQNRFILLIDQAHRLKLIEYEWLVDLHDEVNEGGVDFFVFLIGQRELSGICDELRRSGKTQIIGRFMAARAEYFGIRTERELRECLVCYDERTSFPEGTNWTFTRYFFPEAFAKGWRLAGLAPLLWRLFSEIRTPSSGTGGIEIPLQCFCRVVERFMTEARKQSNGDPVVSERELAEFIAGTCYGWVPPEIGEDDDETEKRE